MLIKIVVGLSLLFQVTAIGVSLRLISVTGWRLSWIFLSLGITTMGIRRFITFTELFSRNARPLPETGYEVVGLLGSILLLLGVLWIRPVFLSITAAERAQRETAERLQEALSNIKTLSGMLPICASCKKIRDDKGYWNQLEGYVRTHSEVEFTHGICPDCAARLYGEFLEKPVPDTSPKSAKGQ